MDLHDETLIALASIVEQQGQELLHVMQLIRILAEEDEDEDPVLDSRLWVQREAWAFTRYGCYWEKEVPDMNEKFFKESFRMDRPTFKLLVERLGVLKKENTNYRNAIPLEKRVAIAVVALASASEYHYVGRLFGVSTSSVCNILKEFCKAVIQNLSEDFLCPNFLTGEKIDECVNGFEKIGFPQCFGAIDGCHIEVKPPPAEAVDHHNYKGWYSIVLLALVDYRFRFLYVNIGCPGRCNDSQIYQQSQLSKMIDSSALLKDKAREMHGTQVPVFLIGDSAFKFSPTLMKPYPFSTSASLEQQTFNYNLSKARRVVENAFGHLKARFRRIGKGLDNHPKFNRNIVLCCCILHNFLNYNNSHINENWTVDSNADKPQPDSSNISGDFSEAAENIRRAVAKFVTGRSSERSESIYLEING